MHGAPAKTVTKREILDIVHSKFPVQALVDYEFLDGAGEIGIIGSVTEPFCSSCTRIRLTADGKLVTCLFAESGFDMKGLLRSGASDAEIQTEVDKIWARRNDRYSDLRWQQVLDGGYQPRDQKNRDDHAGRMTAGMAIPGRFFKNTGPLAVTEIAGRNPSCWPM